jgi:hypothetical protein
MLIIYQPEKIQWVISTRRDTISMALTSLEVKMNNTSVKPILPGEPIPSPPDVPIPRPGDLPDYPIPTPDDPLPKPPGPQHPTPPYDPSQPAPPVPQLLVIPTTPDLQYFSEAIVWG